MKYVSVPRIIGEEQVRKVFLSDVQTEERKKVAILLSTRPVHKLLYVANTY